MDVVYVEFDGAQVSIRTCLIRDEIFVSCIQFLSLIFKEQAKNRFYNLRKSHDFSSILVEKEKIQYVNQAGLDNILSLFRARKVKDFITTYRDALMLKLFGNARLSEENVNMVDNMGKLDSISRMFKDRQSDDPVSDPENDTNIMSAVTEDSGDYGTYLYIRIALPEDIRLNAVAKEGKLLTTNVIKFGITRSPHIRNGEYIKNGHDNGYFAFMYLTNKEVACNTEAIMRLKLKNVTVYNSFEYVDTARLATFLGLDVGTGYQWYFYVAECLYAYILKVSKFIWGDEINNFGMRFLPKQVDGGLCVPGTSSDIAQKLNLIYEKRDLKREHAIAMNIYDESGRVQDLHQPILVKKLYEVETVNGAGTVDDDLITNGEQVIAYNILNGNEMVFDNNDDCMKYFGISSMRTLLSQRAHFLGWVFHHPQFKRWQPPLGFMFRDLSKEKQKKTNNLFYVKSVDESDGKVQYFENKREAVLTLRYKTSDLGYLRAFINKEKVDPYGRKWYICDPSSVGEMVERSSLFLQTSSKLESKVDERTRGRVIARDIETGEERDFGSCTAAADYFKIHRKKMVDDIVDQMRQAYGHVFRFVTTRKRWDPPEYFKYDKNSYEFKTERFVVQKDREGNILGLFESQKAAADILGEFSKKIGDHLRAQRSDKHGRTFHNAAIEECGRWIELDPVQPVEEQPFEGFDKGIIVYDIRTGEDVDHFKTPEAAKSYFEIDPRLIRKHLVDQPRQCNNMAVRNVHNKKRWCPPATLVTDGEYTDIRSDYVVGEKDGKVLVMYESITKASSIRNCDRLRVGKTGDGLFWRRAFKREYDLWVPV